MTTSVKQIGYPPLTSNPSYQEGDGLIAAALRWCGHSQTAIFRIGKIIELGARLTNEAFLRAGTPASDSLKGIAQGARVMWSGTGPFRLPALYKDAYKDFSQWMKRAESQGEGAAGSRLINVINSVCEAVSMTMNSLHMLFSSFVKTSPFFKPIKSVGEVTSWIADFTAVSISVSDLREIHQAVDAFPTDKSPVYVSALKEKERRTLLSVAKEICSATGATFAILALTGYTAAPILALSISLAGVLFATWGSIYEESMAYKCH